MAHTLIFLTMTLVVVFRAAIGIVPGDCRNRTWEDVTPLSWHIHYTTNSSDAPRFYWEFRTRFREHFPPSPQGDLCPFGPNWGSDQFHYLCSLEAAVFDIELLTVGGSPWTIPQRAFFIPIPYLNKTWSWAKENGGGSDVLLHPNTGCMHDDHSLRANWVVGGGRSVAPEIRVLEFPCNVPLTGCNDTIYPGEPSCGCKVPRKSDAPEDSCKHCVVPPY